MEVRTEKKALQMEAPVSSADRLWTETFYGRELEELGDTDVKIVHRRVGEDAVKREVKTDVMEEISLEKREVLSKEKVLEGIVGMLLVCVGDFELSCWVGPV